MPGDSAFEVMLISQEKVLLLVNSKQDTCSPAAAIIISGTLDYMTVPDNYTIILLA